MHVFSVFSLIYDYRLLLLRAVIIVYSTLIDLIEFEMELGFRKRVQIFV